VTYIQGESNLARLNELSALDARAAFLLCCMAVQFAESMVAGMPFASVESLLTASDEATFGLSAESLAQALAGHPRIGERIKANSQTTWSSDEQSGVDQSRDALMADLARVNLNYETIFGHVFLICASGRTGEEMLAESRRRLTNSVVHELAETREQLRLINQIRIMKLVDQS
jgi:2-oxo-4-hydroxy-4-carboxy-5-ureidoimidazoline decarboxylase